jgi:hypothetical protein
MKRFAAIVVFGLLVPLFCFAQSQTGNASYNSSKTGFFISHPSLSFNTKVRVTNLNNNRSVEATVNGRIPITADRIADIARDTGDAIGMTPGGMTPVRIEELALHPAVAVVPPAPAPQPPAVTPQTPAPAPAVAPPAPAPAPQVPAVVPPVVLPPVVTPAPAVIVPQSPAPAPQTPAATPPAAAAPPAAVPEPPAPQAPAAPPTPAPPVQIITEREYISGGSGCPVTNCANTPLLIAILILLILVIALLVVIIILILRRFPFLPKEYRVWLRRHVFFAKRRRK